MRSHRVSAHSGVDSRVADAHRPIGHLLAELLIFVRCAETVARGHGACPVQAEAARIVLVLNTLSTVTDVVQQGVVNCCALVLGRFLLKRALCLGNKAKAMR